MVYGIKIIGGNCVLWLWNQFIIWHQMYLVRTVCLKTKPISRNTKKQIYKIKFLSNLVFRRFW